MTLQIKVQMVGFKKCHHAIGPSSLAETLWYGPGMPLHQILHQALPPTALSHDLKCHEISLVLHRFAALLFRDGLFLTDVAER
ncbi:hypothetical protein A9975_34110 [Cupriavidus sp. UME77]|nr:hypothetical protein [Cupriavidus sp. UME77]